MNIHHVPTPEGEMNYFLFSANFFLGDTFYKMAAAETLNSEGKPAGTITVLVVSKNGTRSFEIYKDSKTEWKCDLPLYPKEELRIVSLLIEDAQKVERPVFDLQEN